MCNGWSNNGRMISQSLAKHKNYFDPTRHCEIKSAQPSPRGTHSPLGQKSIISRRNLHLPIWKTESRDQAVRKASSPLQPAPLVTCPRRQLVLLWQYLCEQSGLEEQHAFETNPSQLLPLARQWLQFVKGLTYPCHYCKQGSARLLNTSATRHIWHTLSREINPKREFTWSATEETRNSGGIKI